MSENLKELAIVGTGIAGVSASIYAKRAGLDFFLFDHQIVGGQLLLMEAVDNYPGLEVGTRGADLAEKLNLSLEVLGIKQIKEKITKVEIVDNHVQLDSHNSKYSVKSLIVATGASFKKLGVEGEDDFLGKGVSYCAICDGFFFRNKEVAVVGGGNTAAEEALYLSNICKKVYLIHRGHRLRAIEYLQKKLLEKENIHILFNTQVRNISGKDLMERITIEDTHHQQERPLQVQGIFVSIGVRPSTEIFRDVVAMDEHGFILTNEEMRTSADQIWACGDCRKRPLRQLVTAASEGAIASLSVYHYIKGSYISA